MEFEQKAAALIKSIPVGKVTTYGRVAALAGNHRGARQVVRVLHSLSGKEGLPWHRVVSGRGRISLPRGEGFEEQRALLVREGVKVGPEGEIDLDAYLWENETAGYLETERFFRKLVMTPVPPSGKRTMKKGKQGGSGNLSGI